MFLNELMIFVYLAYVNVTQIAFLCKFLIEFVTYVNGLRLYNWLIESVCYSFPEISMFFIV